MEMSTTKRNIKVVKHTKYHWVQQGTQDSEHSGDISCQSWFGSQEFISCFCKLQIQQSPGFWVKIKLKSGQSLLILFFKTGKKQILMKPQKAHHRDILGILWYPTIDSFGWPLWNSYFFLPPVNTLSQDRTDGFYCLSNMVPALYPLFLSVPVIKKKKKKRCFEKAEASKRLWLLPLNCCRLVRCATKQSQAH